MKPYTVTIDRQHTIAIFARDRDDAIAFVKRNNQARFHRGEYKKVTGARLVRAGQRQRVVSDTEAPAYA